MPPQVICACPDTARPACHGEPTHEHENRRYCLFHWPSVEKTDEFKEALEEKLKAGDYNFRGVWFPEPLHFIDRHAFETTVDFSHATFNDGVYFIDAEFNAGAKFEDAVFKVGAIFHGSVFERMPVFRGARFEAEAHFGDVHFKDGADFLSAVFSRNAVFARSFFKGLVARFEMARFEQEANFEAATFDSNVNFSEAVFQGGALFIKTTFAVRVNFNRATFRDLIRFEGTETHEMFRQMALAPRALMQPPSLQMHRAEIENPRHVFFENLTLRPRWFARVNARDFNFINVKWDWRGARAEIKSLKEAQVPAPREALEVTCRQLADNANDNHLYEDASKFRYLAMEARRLEKYRGFVPRKLIWWYWLASGYGEHVWQAAGWLAFIWLMSAALYFSMDFPHWQRAPVESPVAATKRVGAWEAGAQALVYSAGVMTLQRPEPRPITTAAQGLVMLETIFGPIQGALLALAIRRKFMR